MMAGPTYQVSQRLEAALHAVRAGEPVLLYDADGREEETDLVVAGQHTTPDHIRAMRTEGGGLICLTLHPRVHQALELPYMTDIFLTAAERYPQLRALSQAEVPYEKKPGSKPSFTLAVNHRDTFTGVTDNDRSLTIRSFAALAADTTRSEARRAQERLAREFKTPGHVFLLNAHPEMLAARRGHTELATALVELAGLTPVATICEMMNGPSGRALPKEDAIKYARQNGRVFLQGNEVLEAWTRANPPRTNGIRSTP